ncbi:MAG: 2-oxoglutarate dehydrogenase E1 component [Weeksellaceae bacterium]|nr:2-oxoglutarate dehydrogenase E1 component [Weeksellaceae bacterium]
MDRFSFLNAVHAEFVEELYEKYKKFPDAVNSSWRAFFQGYDFGQENYGLNGEFDAAEALASDPHICDDVRKEFRVIDLINSYRKHGHLFTDTNPVRDRREYPALLELSNFDLNDHDLEVEFEAGVLVGKGGKKTLKKIIEHLEIIYCASIGVEYMYIRERETKQWIQDWLNENLTEPQLSKEEKRQALHKLNEAVAFESFLHTKFVGQKRFSVEGNDTVIPALDEAINRGAELGVKEFVVGMAHRGRLNVLANIFRKPYSQIFSEFEKKEFEEDYFDGDVKYHLGSTTTTKTYKGKEVKINLAPNPSHLEAVASLVVGITRAKADLEYEQDYRKILPIVLHGDAAIAGQGIVYEIAQMETLDGYKTGGTLHIVLNNQIGFTTNYLDGRSSTYCTDVAKINMCPVMHVNADDTEAVIHAIRFAIDYRQKFQRDIYIDLLGYRKYGHNEGDEPRFTQPKLYNIIAKHPNAREIYKEVLSQEGIVGEEFIQEMEQDFKDILEQHFEDSKKIEKNTLDPFMPELWDGINIALEHEMLESVDTKFSGDTLKEITEVITTLPEPKKDFIRKVVRLHEQRRDMVFKHDKIDWGMAEALAYGSLLTEGFNVRVSGEDVERGTFSHRHAVVKKETNEEEFILLNHLREDQGWMQIYNSLLSEYGVLGFDYGYAMAAPNTLTIWEAQFGDFANAAQIIIDQYISAAEDKWKIQNGLVMLLPHGYEGQGAEHSSARLERFLQLSAQANMFIVNCTTPANFFHALRRQLHAEYRKPLVVFTPKSLLRHPLVVSPLEDLSNGTFHTWFDDDFVDKDKVERVVFCQGKLYYDLHAHREENKIENVALIRLEQLYPLDLELFEKVLKSYPNHTSVMWSQEEPENMGAWAYIYRVTRKLKIDWEFVSPRASAAPASGSTKRWSNNQAKVINDTFNFSENR